MRLTCPNCDAEYEVDDSMIPPEGRDVQCSNCETTWFQTDPDKVSETPGLEVEKKFPDGVGAAAIAAARGSQQRSAIDPDALAVIEQEVAYETEARKSETVDTAEPAAAEASEDVSTHVKEIAEEELRALEQIDRTPAKPDPTPEPAADSDDPNAKSGRLPDVEEINSSLASPPDPVDEADAEAAAAATYPARRARGFRLGFGLVLLLAAALLMIYAYAPQLAERLPTFSDQLASYVAAVDRGRVWLDITATGLTEKINAWIGQLTGEG